MFLNGKRDRAALARTRERAHIERMSIDRDRVLLPLTNWEATTAEEPVFDVASLFLHLLLFDKVIVPTMRLLDLVAVVKTVGFKPTMELLEADCLSFRSEIDEIGTSNVPQGDLCEMVYIWSPDPEKDLSSNLGEISKLGLPRPDRDTLKRAIVRRCLGGGGKELPYMIAAMRTATRDAIDRSPTFMAALDLKLGQAKHKLLTRDQISAEKLADRGQLRFRLHGVDWTPKLTEAVRAATVAVASLEAEFGHMERDNAVGGIEDDSIGIMERKVKSLWEAIRPGERVEQFYRVQSIAKMPDFRDWLRDPGLDMTRFLEVRETSECREFREFVSKSGSLDDQELHARTTSVSAKISDRLSSGIGKTLRALSTTGLGLVPAAFTMSPEAGIAIGGAASFTASAADAFLVDKVFKPKGIISFIGAQYPSIFK